MNEGILLKGSKGCKVGIVFMVTVLIYLGIFVHKEIRSAVVRVVC
jgi:hypothetical protein